MKSGKKQMTAGVEPPNQNARRKGHLQILRGIRNWHHHTDWNERKNLKREYLKRTRNWLETKLCSRNLVKGIDTCAVPLATYSGTFLEWTKEELKQMEQRTRKLMTMIKTLHPWNDVKTQYVSGREGGRRLVSIEDSVDASIQRLEDYIEKHGERQITTSRNNPNDTRISRTTISRKQKWREKTNSMGVLSDLQATSHTRKRGCD